MDRQGRDRQASSSDRRAQLVERRLLAAGGTLQLTFRVIDGQPFDFLPGSFVSVASRIPNVGNRHSPYCLVSRPGEAPNFRLLVRLVDSGARSAWLGALKVDDLISFRGPGGHSMLPRLRDHDLILCATGVGVGPLLPLAVELLRSGFRRPVRLFWGLRLAEDICLEDELNELAAAHSTFSYDIALSQPPPDWKGLSGRITSTVPPLLSTLGRSEFRLVGNGAMTAEMATALAEMGVADGAIATEAYFNGRHRPEPNVLADIRAGFVATDTSAPAAMDIADLFRLERPLGKPPKTSR